MRYNRSTLCRMPSTLCAVITLVLSYKDCVVPSKHPWALGIDGVGAYVEKPSEHTCGCQKIVRNGGGEGDVYMETGAYSRQGAFAWRWALTQDNTVVVVSIFIGVESWAVGQAKPSPAVYRP